MTEAYFSEKDAKRIVRAVRAVERMGGDAIGPSADVRLRGPHFMLVQITDVTTTEGLFPARMLVLSSGTSTTTTDVWDQTSTTSSTTTTTTPNPAAGRYYVWGNGAQDCWLALALNDVANSPAVGDIHVALFIGPRKQDGLAIFVKSDVSPPTTTTTPGPCTGLCRYEWDHTLKVWNLVSNSCATTSTTTSTTTTGTGTTGTGTTSSTTTTTPAPCACIPPAYCGTQQCESTTTNCRSGGGPPTPPCAGTTTTSGTTTTVTGTTTTPPPNCTQGCDWRWKLGQWWPIFTGCDMSNCPCPRPTGAGNDCELAHTPCRTTTTTPGPPCTGLCQWFYDPDTLKWVLLDGRCTAGTATGCKCDPPTIPGNPCGLNFTPCLPPTPGTGTSTTTTTGPCQAFCTWKWTGSDWTVLTNDCNNTLCGCYTKPGFNGTSTCDTAQMPCSVATTTTSTTTTTTCAPTTTQAPTCGQCVFRWTDTGGGTGFWTLQSTACTGSCACAAPTTAGNTGCDLIRKTKCVVQCTTTTCTSTTPGPATCGRCFYSSQPQGPDVNGCPRYGWVINHNGCYNGGTCTDPQCLPSGPNQYTETNCTGCATTTTTSSTTTTTTLPPDCGNCEWACTSSGWVITSAGCSGRYPCLVCQPILAECGPPYTGVATGGCYPGIK